MTSFPRHQKLAEPDEAHISFLLSQKKRHKSKLSKPEKRAEEGIQVRQKAVQRWPQCKLEVMNFVARQTKNGSIINYRRRVLQVQGGERGTVESSVFFGSLQMDFHPWIWVENKQKKHGEPIGRRDAYKPIFENDLRDYRTHIPPSSGLISIDLCSSKQDERKAKEKPGILYWTVCKAEKLYRQEDLASLLA